jgi:uncharacterized membrane protein
MTRNFKSYFFRGLAVLLPTGLTLWILAAGYKFIQQHVTVHINQGIVWLIMHIQGDAGPSKEDLTRILVEGTAGSVLGFFVALIAVCIVGALLASVVGRVLWGFIETFIKNTPLLNRIYPYVKQVTDFILTRKEQEKLFSRVVAVEYPRKGIWSIGLVTGTGIRDINRRAGTECLTVLIPNSPTPVTGYVILVPREQTIPLEMTIEEAFRFALSAGVIAPGQQHFETSEPLCLQHE